jgi:hypothetical protein
MKTGDLTDGRHMCSPNCEFVVSWSHRSPLKIESMQTLPSILLCVYCREMCPSVTEDKGIQKLLGE